MNLTLQPDHFLEKLHSSELRPCIMGIINATPDSFYSPSSVKGMEALSMALRFISEGVDILDIGGESTRPGSQYISAEEEMDRVLPVIESIRQESDIPISIDTRKAEVAKKAVVAGANCVNDISALRDDPELGYFVAENNLPVILMHMQGEPGNMQEAPLYRNVVDEVKSFLQQRINYAQSIGISCKQIIIDPGLGFGKTYDHNIQILHKLDYLVEMGFPVLVAHSRKSFIGWILGYADKRHSYQRQIRAIEQRLYGSLGVVADSYMKGARIFRVHDVAATRDLLETMHQIKT